MQLLLLPSFKSYYNRWIELLYMHLLLAAPDITTLIYNYCYALGRAFFYSEDVLVR